MKIKNGFILRNVSDAYVVVAVGEAAKDFNGMITLNETGAFLWKTLADGCADKNELVTKLLSEYDVDKALAERDVDAFVKKLDERGLLTE